MKYYGVICCELDGSLEDIEVESNEIKPTTEFCGFSFCKWHDTPERRNKTKEYLRKAIDERKL